MPDHDEPVDDPLTEADEVAFTRSIDAGLMLEAYRLGLFAMPYQHGYLWFRPVRRGVLPLDGLRVTKSLRKSARRYRTTVDTAFERVLDACADPGRDGGWIDARLHEAYCSLYDSGLAHSVETWNDRGELVGGLFGVGMGGWFAGESMFHLATDASKVALVRLVEVLSAGGVADRLLDVQWVTPHLASLGAVEVTAAEYERRLGRALALPDIEFDRELPAPVGQVVGPD